MGSTKDDVSAAIAYAVDDKTGVVTYYTLSSFIGCTEGSAVDVFHLHAERGRGRFKREAPRTKSGEEVVAWHLHQNFDGVEVSPQVANEIGYKLAAEIFGGRPCVVSTHTNTDNIHNHIVVCAWGEDGRKWNNNNANYRKIREASDRLCEEYGLSVLEHTRNVKLIPFRDAEGKLHYFEPTDRKLDIIRGKEAGENASADYRNAEKYKDAAAKDETNKDTIKSDIDTLLPAVKSYEELLERLRVLGYSINDKKKDGGWLKHITFTAPLQQKGTRDYRLGDGVFYTREALSKHISDREADRSKEAAEGHIIDKKAAEMPPLKYFDSYVYGETDLNDIDDDYRSAIEPGGVTKIVPRSGAEKAVIADVRRCDYEVRGLIDASELRRIIEEQRDTKPSGRKRSPPEGSREAHLLVKRIQEGFDNLRFMERHGIHSYTQISVLYKACCDSYTRCLSQLAGSKRLVGRLEAVLESPRLAAEVEARMAASENRQEYEDELMFEGYNADARLLAGYKRVVGMYGLEDEGKRDGLRAALDKAQDKIAEISGLMEGYRADLAGYEGCVRVLSRIDAENRRDVTTEVERFEKIRKESRRDAERAAGAAPGRTEDERSV